MLTNDLLRVKIHKKTVRPRFLDVSKSNAQEKADALTTLFDTMLNQTRGEIEAAVDEAIGYGTDFLIWRGLAKLLYDRSEFETVAEADPVEIRRAVFEASSSLGPVVDDTIRLQVLEAAAAQLSISAQDCEDGLYADLQAEQRMTKHKRFDGEALLQRYNVALAQAVLYRATRLVISLHDEDPNHLRYLFQSLKFFGLMHRAWRVKGGMQLEVDGPASLFSKNRKYGLQMAKFLPALLLMDDWHMAAELQWEKDKQYAFELGPEDQLTSHYQARGQWISDEEKQFEQRFAALAKKADDWPWTLERRGTIVELDAGEVLVPDYVLTHSSGQEVFVEIVGFWRKAYLQRRMTHLTQLTQTPLILVVGQHMRSDKEALEAMPPQVVFFKSVILVKNVLNAALDALGLESS